MVIDRSKTAPVIIDLQKDITAMPNKPYKTQEVISNAAELVDALGRTK